MAQNEHHIHRGLGLIALTAHYARWTQDFGGLHENDIPSPKLTYLCIHVHSAPVARLLKLANGREHRVEAVVAGLMGAINHSVELLRSLRVRALTAAVAMVSKKHSQRALLHALASWL